MSKTRTIILAIGSLLILASMSWCSDLSLQDCVSLALANNLKLSKAQSSLEQSRLGVTEAYSSYYPSLNLSSGYNYSRDGRYSTSVGAGYSLYKGGSIGAGVKLAKAKVEMTEEEYRQAEDEIILSVKEAFFGILQNQEQLGLAKGILTRRNEALVLIKLRYEAGRESLPAVKEAEADLSKAEFDKMRAEEELSLSHITLNLLLGRPRNQEIAIAYEDEKFVFPALEKIISDAKSGRPEMRSLSANTRALDAQLTQAKSGYYPSVSLSSSYGWSGSELWDQEGSWGVGISLSFSLFDGFARRASVGQAKLSIKENNIEMRELEQELEQEIEQAWINLKLAEKTVEVNEKTLQAAKDIYQLTKMQYEQGKTSYFFLQQKESDLTSAENAIVSAQYNLRVMDARLLKAWGKRI